MGQGILILGLALSGFAILEAQEAHAPMPPLSQTKGESELAGSVLELALPPYEEEAFFSPGELRVGASGEDLGRLGSPVPRWRVAPHLYMRATYDDNIFIQPTDRSQDLIFTLAPGVAFGWWHDGVTLENYAERRGRASRLETAPGDFLYFDYTMVDRLFTNNTGESSVGHEALLRSAWDSGVATRMGLELAYSSGTVADEDIGTLVDRQLLAGVLDASWDLSAKTSLKSALNFEYEEYDGFLSETEWRLDEFVSWAATPLLNLEPGLALGYLDAGSKDQQRYLQLLLRSHSKRFSKLSLEGTSGVEFRHSENFSDTVAPVGRIRVTYDMSARTQWVLESYQRVLSSAREGLGIYRTSGVSLGLEQKLRGGAFLSLASGYEWARYDKSEDDGEARRDGYFFANARFIYNFNRWFNAGLGLQHRRNDSNEADFDYRSNQVSVEASLLY